MLTSSWTIYNLLQVDEVLRQLATAWHKSNWASEERWVDPVLRGTPSYTKMQYQRPQPKRLQGQAVT